MFWDWILLGVVFFLEFIHHGDYTVETLGHICPQPVLKEPNAQSAVRSVALITSVSYSHCLPLRLWGSYFFCTVQTPKSQKVKRKCLKGYSEITFKAFPSFQAFSFFSWAPAGNWCIGTFSLWMCVLKGGGGIHILDIFFLKIWVEHVIMAGDN